MKRIAMWGLVTFALVKSALEKSKAAPQGSQLEPEDSDP